MTVRQNLLIRQGETWAYTYAHSADLTGYTARMSLRSSYSDGLLAYLSTGSDANGGAIAIDGTDITLSMTDAQTTAILTNELFPLLPESTGPVERYKKLIYDLEIVSPAGTVTRLLEGDVTYSRGVTT